MKNYYKMIDSGTGTKMVKADKSIVLNRLQVKLLGLEPIVGHNSRRQMILDRRNGVV